MEPNTFLARELNEYQAKNWLVGKKIKIVRTQTDSRSKLDQTVTVDDIESGVGEDDLKTDVAYIIEYSGGEREVRVWDNDSMEITIL